MLATSAYYTWLQAGRPWKEAAPVKALADTLRGHGYTVYALGDDSHLTADQPEDHAPFSGSGWPNASPRWWVHALDIMPPTVAGLPSLAQLGAQIYADRQSGSASWLKYMNWEPSGPNGPCFHDEWQPGHTRTDSTDRGHIHISIRSDYTTSNAAANYDPVAAIRGVDDMGTLDDPQADWLYNASAVIGNVAQMNSTAGVRGDKGQAGTMQLGLVTAIQKLSADMTAVKATLAGLAGKDFTDEPAIVAGVLAGLTPAGIAAAVAAALPAELAAQVVSELSQRLASTHPSA
jgi:hypothetical protein